MVSEPRTRNAQANDVTRLLGLPRRHHSSLALWSLGLEYMDKNIF